MAEPPSGQPIEQEIVTLKREDFSSELSTRADPWHLRAFGNTLQLWPIRTASFIRTFWFSQDDRELGAQVVGYRYGAQRLTVCASGHDGPPGHQLRSPEGLKFESNGGTSELRDRHFNVNHIVVTDQAEVIAFDVDAGQIVGVAGIIGDAECAQELDLRRFEVPEEGGKVNAAARIGIDEADARLKAEGFTWGHALTMP